MVLSTMTDEQGQIALAACARDLLGRPESCERTLRHIGGTEQLQHRECAQRSRLLALHLEQALHSADAHAYPAGYARYREGGLAPWVFVAARVTDIDL